MTIDEAKQRIESAGGNWSTFQYWMQGQTCGVNPETGEPDIYKYDVERFIEYKCNPKNEPVDEWD